jgi:hypothetical protein
MNDKQLIVTGLAGIGLVTLFYLIAQQDDPRPVPNEQQKEDMVGVNAPIELNPNAGTPLDLDYRIHGWHPGYDPEPTVQPVTRPRCGYPAVSGGNMSNVMHYGYSSLLNNQPPDRDWWLNPPEAAVL